MAAKVDVIFLEGAEDAPIIAEAGKCRCRTNAVYYIVLVGSAAFSREGAYVKMFLIILEVGPTFVFIK
jgi:hypothetical protein